MTRVQTLTAALLTTALLAGSAAAGTVTDDLREILTLRNDEPVGALVYMIDQVDLHTLDAQMALERLSRKERHTEVVRALQDTAAATQGDLAAHLGDLERQGIATDVEPLWIINGFSIVAPAEEIERIAARDDVYLVYPDYGIELVAPIEYEPVRKVNDVGGAITGAPEAGVVAVRAPEVWSQGITGEGVLVATLDTGVEGTHPAVASRWRGLDPAYAGNPDWAWFDPVTSTTFPGAFGGHGTHTMGSVCGGAPGDQVGVAPGASWIHAAVIDRVDIPTTVSDSILAFQWLVDPDGNPATIFDVPVVCSNSWGLTTGHGYPPCDETFWSFLDACESAGIVILFSAGNEGTSGLRRPADRATDDYRSLAVAAVNANIPGWPIASFSSRGPTNCTPDGSPAIKPDIAAPGEDVRSAWPGGGYTSLDGTSMASPHVNGVVALMFQACPDLTVEDVKQILYDTAFDLGSAGEDNDYGWGMVDAYEAVQRAFDLCGPNPPRARDAAYQTAVATPLPITLLATDYDDSPGGPLTYRIRTLPAAGNTLTDAGNGHVITPGELPYDLVGNGDQVTYTPAGGYWGNDAFQFAADDGGSPPDAGEGDPATVSILVLYDAPMITTPSIPDGYLNLAYGPVQIEADQGQPVLDWSVIEDQYAEQDLGSSQFAGVGAARNWHADDNSWNYSLPFTFPFYENLYTSVWVCSNGFIDFASNSAYWGNSDSELISNVRIAPMWDDLRTDCGAGDDIYIDEGTPGQVTIRWEGVRYVGGCSTQEINVSVTLYDDGRMRFHYGAANTGLSPTIGISAGDGVRYLLTSYNNAGSLTNADTLEVFPPSPLPDGLTLSASGVLSGTPLELGTFEPRIRVIDSLGRTDQRQYAFEIGEGNPADVNGDGTIGFDDLLLVLSNWGPCVACPEDVNGDGIVGFDDVLEILSNWS